MKTTPLLLLLAVGAALCLRPALAASPTDIVPRGSGLYDALAVLAQDGLLPPGSPDVNDLLNVQGRLYTRAELARAVAGSGNENPRSLNDRDRAALAFARSVLAPELGLKGGEGTSQSSFGASAVGVVETGGRSDTSSNLKAHGSLYGRGRLFGTLGRDGAYTVSATNFYTQFRDHASFTTRAGGTAGGDNPGALNGIDEAYVTALGGHGVRLTAGLLRQRWGAAYRSPLVEGDNAPARPTLQLELPFSLGRTLGRYTFTQNESTYRNLGRTIYEGERRLEHPIGDRTTLSLAESYESNQFNKPLVLVVPYYTFQAHVYPNGIEYQFYKYLADANLTVRPDGPQGSSRAYLDFAVGDIKAPAGLGKGNNVPRKIAYTIGYARVFPQTGTDAVLEFNHTDRATFTDVEAELARFYRDLPQSSPVGPNGNELFLRIGQRIGARLDIAVEARDRRRVASDFPAPNARSVDILLGYRLSRAQSLGLRLSDYREDPFTGVTDSPSGTFGGAANGQRLRRRIIALSFLQSF